MTKYSAPMPSNRSTSPLNHPGQLLANLPAIFGFYPNDSVVIAAFEHIESTRFVLGPVIRVDIDNLDALGEIEGRTELRADLLFAFIIGEDLSEEEVTEIASCLLDFGGHSGALIDACWATDAVLSGQPYRIVFGPDTTSWPESPFWVGGKISEVAAAQAMEPWAKHGELPELSRSDAFDRYSRFNPMLAEEDIDDLETFAYRNATEIRDSPAASRAKFVGSVVTDFRLLLEDIADETPSGEELLGDDEMLAFTGIVLSATCLRDAVVSDVIERPQEASALLLAAARTFSGTLRANALCLHTVAVVHLGFSMAANPALHAALREVPGHSLSQLLLDAATQGIFEHMIECVDEGSRQTRESFGV